MKQPLTLYLQKCRYVTLRKSAFFETLAKQWICWKWNCQKALSMKLLFTRTIPRTGMPVKNSKCFLRDASTIALTWYDTHVESWTANLPTSQPATCQSGSGRTVVMSVLRCCPISDVEISWSLQTAGRSRQKTLRSYASWQVWILWNSALRLVVDASHRFTCTRFLSKKKGCAHLPPQDCWLGPGLVVSSRRAVLKTCGAVTRFGGSCVITQTYTDIHSMSVKYLEEIRFHPYEALHKVVDWAVLRVHG